MQTADPRADIKALHEQICHHPGKKAHDRWENLMLTYQGIYIANRASLISTLKAPSANEELLVELIQNMRPRTVREQYEHTLLREFHNYIAASFSLIDHSRRFIKEYMGSDFSKEYDARRNVIADTPEHCFLKDIRNYVIHRDIPPLGFSLHIHDDMNSETFMVFFSIDKLKLWNKWSSKSKIVLNAQPNNQLDILALINLHGTLIDNFYKWIFDQFHELHGADIDAVNELIRLTQSPGGVWKP